MCRQHGAILLFFFFLGLLGSILGSRITRILGRLCNNTEEGPVKWEYSEEGQAESLEEDHGSAGLMHLIILDMTDYQQYYLHV